MLRELSPAGLPNQNTSLGVFYLKIMRTVKIIEAVENKSHVYFENDYEKNRRKLFQSIKDATKNKVVFNQMFKITCNEKKLIIHTDIYIEREDSVVLLRLYKTHESLSMDYRSAEFNNYLDIQLITLSKFLDKKIIFWNFIFDKKDTNDSFLIENRILTHNTLFLCL